MQSILRAIREVQTKGNGCPLRKVEVLVEIGQMTKDCARAEQLFDLLVKAGKLEAIGADSYSVMELSPLSPLSPPPPPFGTRIEA